MEPVTIVPMNHTHHSDLIEIEERCFAQPWLRRSIGGLEKTRHFAAFVALERDRAIGYICMNHVKEQADITSVGVLPEKQKMGVGSQLLCALLAFARARAITNITLEVRKSNFAAQKLYCKFGFRRISIRKGYYTNPAEDALVLLWEPNGTENHF